MTLENNRAHLLHHIKLRAAFQSHWYIQSGVTDRKPLIRVKMGEVLSCLTLKIDGWPCKTTGHLLFTTPSIVHDFKSIGEVKLELESGNAQFGSKLEIFCPAWPWNWWMTLKNNRVHLLYYIKLCVAFQSHWYIQSGVTVGKRPIRVKIYDPETTKWGHDLCELDLWPLTWTFCMNITSVNGNNAWKFQDYTMRGTLSKRCDGRTDGRTDRQRDRRKYVFLELLGRS